jgi:hypothetical protein
MFIIPSGFWSSALAGSGALIQLCCLFAVISIVKSLRLGGWISWLFGVSVLGPLAPFAMTLGFVTSVHMYTFPAWMLALGTAAPLALAMIAIRCRAGTTGLMDRAR